MIPADGAALTGLLPGAAQAAVFASAVLVLNATPGVDLLLTVSRSLQGGARAGVAAALGINAGCVVHALAAAFGLAALLALYPTTFRLIQWAGAAYLVWLGLGMLRQAWTQRRAPAVGLVAPTAAATGFESASAGISVPSTSSAFGLACVSADPGVAATPAGDLALRPRAFVADFRLGLLTNLLNPKVALFFLAFLPQFVPVVSPHKTLSFLLLGAWFVLQSLCFLLLVVLLTQRLARLPASPQLRAALHTAGGLLFLGLAARLLGSRPVAG